MQMIGFWMLKGHDPDKLANLTFYEQVYYSEIMKRHYEEEAAKNGG